MRKRFPGPNPLDELDLPQAREPMPPEYLDQMDADHVDIYHQLFLLDPTTTAQAFMALASIVASKAVPGLDEPDRISIPLWAAKAIAIGFDNYREAVKEGRTLSVGVAMGLESKRKGSKPRLVKEDLRLRDWNMALAVLLEINRGSKATAAVPIVASKFLVSDKTVWRIWAKHQEFVTKCLANHHRALTR